jgi:hypothetical protein
MKFVEFTQTNAKSVANGLISDVHILGFTSKNGREYARDAVVKAMPLYEDMAVYVDHAPGQPRKAEDRFGKLTNVRIADDGLRGDLQYLTEHPMAMRVQEDLQKNLNYFGLSHDATGKGIRRGRKTVVESISAVNSVDLVSGAASVAGLLEQQAKEEGEEDEAVETPEAPAAPMAKAEVDNSEAEELMHKALLAAVTAVLADRVLSVEEIKTKILAVIDAHLSVSAAMEKQEDVIDDGEHTTEQTLQEQLNALRDELAAVKAHTPKYLPPRSVPASVVISEQTIPTDIKALGKWLKR